MADHRKSSSGSDELGSVLRTMGHVVLLVVLLLVVGVTGIMMIH